MKVPTGHTVGNVRFDYFDGLFYYLQRHCRAARSFGSGLRDLFLYHQPLRLRAQRSKGLRQFCHHRIRPADIKRLPEIADLLFEESLVDAAMQQTGLLFPGQQKICAYAEDAEQLLAR